VRALFFLSTLAVLYLSLFPASFDWSRSPVLWPPYKPVRYRSDVVDVIVNIPFYMPLGFTAVAAWSKRRDTRAILLATLLGAAISYTVEFIQHFEPRRFSSSRDILLNTLGAALGAWLATLPRFRRLNLRQPLYAFSQTPAAWWLISLWWLWLAFPFVPNFRLVQLRRMWEHSQEEWSGLGFSLVLIASHFTGGAVLASVARSRRWLMPALALAALATMPLIYGLRFSPTRVAATLAGCALAYSLNLPKRHLWLALLVSAWAATYLLYYGAPGLAPYDTTWEVTPEIARASWRTPIRDTAGKLFLVSALLWAWWPRRR
jgi:VanZ family protein